MKQQANKSFFGLKWLAVLIATLLLVGTLHVFQQSMLKQINR